MFENLRRAFKEAYENFKEELDRDAVPETVNRLLHQMTEEAADTRAHIKKLEEDITRTLKEADLHKQEAQTCRRREKMAMDIDDEETAKLARDFAEKHEQRTGILERKALALKQEFDLSKSEFAEMLETIKTAKANRSTLAAQAGRSAARDSLGGADDLFAQLDQIEQELDDADHMREAEAELRRDVEPDNEMHVRFDEPIAPRDREAEAEDKLERLKRMMGRED